MKQLSRIIETIYNKPWLILPATHKSLVRQLDAHMAGIQTQMPLWDVDEEDESNLYVPTSPVDVVCVDGIIGKHLSMLETQCGGVDLDEVAEELKTARDNVNTSKIVMYFNTPGGCVTGVPEMGQLISEVNQVKPIYAYTDTLCASAGMWLASQCEYVMCSPSSEIGSVGVYSLYLDATRYYENEGLKLNPISAGKYKLTGADFKPMTDEERTMLQTEVDNIYKQFKTAVLSKRKVADEYLQGQCFDGETAVSVGLADGNFNSIDDLIETLSVDNME